MTKLRQELTHSVAFESLSDNELSHYAKTDREAYAELYRRHVNSIYRYCLSRVGNSHDAQDLTSLTFFAVLKSISKYKPRNSFKSWLVGIAKHKIADYFRGTKRENTSNELFVENTSLRSAEEVVDERLRLDRVVQALSSISTNRAEAISMFLFGGLSASEIATILDKSESAVKMLICRGVRDLHQRLGENKDLV